MSKNIKRRSKKQPLLKQITTKQISETKKQFAQKQNYICPLCKTDFSDHDFSKIHLDHDHETGMIRGALCAGCNRFEGKTKNAKQRFLKNIEISFEDFVKNLVEHWESNKTNPSYILHPDFKTKLQKKMIIKKRRNKIKNAKNNKADRT